MTHNLIIAAVGAGIALLRVSFAMREKLIGKPIKYLLLIVTMLSCIPQVPETLYSPVLPVSILPPEILENMDKMGVDSSIYLNRYESDYFDEIFKNKRGIFDFNNKKIGFIEDECHSNKIRFFSTEKFCQSTYQKKMGCTLYIFHEGEKEESGGYDAAILFSSKTKYPIHSVISILRKEMIKE